MFLCYPYVFNYVFNEFLFPFFIPPHAMGNLKNKTAANAKALNMELLPSRRYSTAMPQLTLDEFTALQHDSLLVVDTRPPAAFMLGSFAESIYVANDHSFIETLQLIAADDQHLVIVAEPTVQTEIARKLKAAGGFTVDGFIDDPTPFTESKRYQMDIVIGIDADEFAMDYQFDEFFLIDIRDAESFANVQIEDSENIPLDDLEAALAQMDAGMRIYVVAQTADKALTGASLFKRYGFQQVRAVLADFDTIENHKVPFKRKSNKGSKPAVRFHPN